MLVTLQNWTTDTRILAAALRSGLASEAGLLALAHAAEYMDERMVAAALYLFVKDKKVRGEVVKHVQKEMGPSTTYTHAAKSVHQLRSYILLEYFWTEGVQ
jgi:hypothetical protein